MSFFTHFGGLHTLFVSFVIGLVVINLVLSDKSKPITNVKHF